MSILNNQMFTTNTKNLELPPLNAEMLWGFLLYTCLAGQSYETNLKNSSERNLAPVPQSIIVDTTLMTAGDITILWDKGDLNYSLTVQSGSKQVFTVPAIADCVYSVTFSSDATGGDVRIDLVNFPLIPKSYSGAYGEAVNVMNFPEVQHVRVINFPAVQAVEGDVLIKPSAASLVSGKATASGSNVIGTPPANSNLRLLNVSLTGNSAQATAGILSATIALNGVTVAVLNFFVPATSANIISGIEHHRDFANIAFNSGSAGTLTCDLSSALTAGEISIDAYF